MVILSFIIFSFISSDFLAMSIATGWLSISTETGFVSNPIETGCLSNPIETGCVQNLAPCVWVGSLIVNPLPGFLNHFSIGGTW